MTPYEYHATLNHSPMSRYSPNGVDIVEECDCGQRWIHNPSIGYPVTLCPLMPADVAPFNHDYCDHQLANNG